MKQAYLTLYISLSLRNSNKNTIFKAYEPKKNYFSTPLGEKLRQSQIDRRHDQAIQYNINYCFLNILIHTITFEVHVYDRHK